LLMPPLTSAAPQSTPFPSSARSRAPMGRKYHAIGSDSR
jgi:hypothetical protein